jgi:excisionase family DNA binding protein
MLEKYTAVIFGREREIVSWTDRGTLVLADGSQLAVVSIDRPLKGKVWRIARLKFEDSMWWLDGKDLTTGVFDLRVVTRNKTGRALPYDASLPFPEVGGDIEEFTHFETVTYLASLLTGSMSLSTSQKQVLREQVVGVAWLEDYFRQDGIYRNPAPKPPGKKVGLGAKVDEEIQAIDEMLTGFKGEPLTASEAIPEPKRYLPVFLTRCDFLVTEQSPGAPNATGPEWFTSYALAADYAGVTLRTIGNWIRRGMLPVERNGRKICIARTNLDKCRKRL